jgi:hypothetical protein
MSRAALPANGCQSLPELRNFNAGGGGDFSFFTIFTFMKYATLGNPSVMQAPFTRFYIHYLDLNRMDNVLGSSGIIYFAMETPTSQIHWVLHIPDEHQAHFDELVVLNGFNLSAMQQPFWYHDREKEAIYEGSLSKTSRNALVVVLVVLLLVVIAGYLL